MLTGRGNPNSLTAKQFVEWMEYAKLEPFSELRADYRAASIVQMIANVNRGPKQEPFKLDDMRVKFGEQPPKPGNSRSLQIMMIKAFATAYGAKEV